MQINVQVPMAMVQELSDDAIRSAATKAEGWVGDCMVATDSSVRVFELSHGRWPMSGGEDDSLSMMGLFTEEQRYRFWMGLYLITGELIMGQTKINKSNAIASPVIHLRCKSNNQTLSKVKHYEINWILESQKMRKHFFLLLEETILEL
jgi:hypothetical protein